MLSIGLRGQWQLRWNSNPHFTDFESAPSADWGTEPYLSQADFLPHSYFQHQLVNDVANPNPFHYAEQIDWCALLGITVFRTTATRFHAYLICLTHVPIIRTPRVLIAFCKCGHDQLYNDGCSFHSIYYSSCTPQLGVQLITSSVGFVAPSSLHSQLYHT